MNKGSRIILYLTKLNTSSLNLVTSALPPVLLEDCLLADAAGDQHLAEVGVGHPVSPAHWVVARGARTEGRARAGICSGHC